MAIVGIDAAHHPGGQKYVLRALRFEKCLDDRLIFQVELGRATAQSDGDSHRRATDARSNCRRGHDGRRQRCANPAPSRRALPVHRPEIAASSRRDRSRRSARFFIQSICPTVFRSLAPIFRDESPCRPWSASLPRLLSGFGRWPAPGTPSGRPAIAAGKIIFLPAPPGRSCARRWTRLQQTIESAWERRAELAPLTAPAAIRDAVAAVIADLDAGRRPRRRKARWRVGHAPMAEESGAAVVPAGRERTDRPRRGRRAVPLLRQGADQVRAVRRPGASPQPACAWCRPR